MRLNDLCHLYILVWMKNLHAQRQKSLDRGSPKVGLHLRAARKAVGLSSEFAAGKLGITHVTLNRYENDHREVGAGVLMKMCLLYRVQIGALLHGDAAPTAVVPKQIPVRGRFLSRDKFELNFLGAPLEMLPVLSINPNVFAMQVVGPWMGPTAYDGEYLLVERPDPSQVMELSNRSGGGLELMRSEPLGKVIGVFRKAK